MKKADQKEDFIRVVEFFEKMIEKSLENKDFDIARSWYYEMNGACFLEGRLGLIDPVPNNNSEWFKRIQEAQYGRAGGAQA